MSWDAVIFDFEDTLVDISRGKPPRRGPVYYSGAKGVPPVTDRAGRPVVEVLTLLGEAGIPVAVITSSPEAAMRRWFQEHQFALPVAIIGFHDTVLHRPSPHPLLEALSQMGLMPSERVLSVGDSADDITAAHRAGVTAATVREFVPASYPPDLFLPFVESFFDDERCFSLAGDVELGGPSVSLQLELPGHVCRVGGTKTESPRNRLTSMLSGARDGNWPRELIDLAKTLVQHAVGSDSEGVVLTWVPARQGRADVLKTLMLTLKDETQLTVSPLLRFRSDPGEQASRDRPARATSMTNTMEARGKVNLSGRTIVVIDDYRCTGATLAEAARALREAGASRVVGLALAQEVHRTEEPRAKYGPLIAAPATTPGTFGTATRAAPVVDVEAAAETVAEPAVPAAPAEEAPRVAPQQPATPLAQRVESRENRGPEPVRTPIRARRTPMPGPRLRPGAGTVEQPSESPASIKQRYPRAYQRWTPEEDALLTRLYRQGKDLPTMCAALGRQMKSVETRIRRIEVDIDESDFADDGSGEFPPEGAKPNPTPTPTQGTGGGPDANDAESSTGAGDGDGTRELGAG